MKNSTRSENCRKSLNSIGLSSLLVIFVVLASVTLSVMCLITVRQDLDRAKKLAVTHEEYYSADTKATEKLDSLYLLLANDSVTDIAAAARELGIEVTGGTRENVERNRKQREQACLQGGIRKRKSRHNKLENYKQ